MHTYYYNGELKDTITLNEVESNHVVKVMRSKIGSEVRIINGEGSVAIGVVENNHAKKCEVSIDTVEYLKPSDKKITIAIAPTKSNDRIEFFIEKATEIGVFKIIPLICQNNERDKIKIERWEKIALAATKQSKRSWLPIIEEPISVLNLYKDNELPETKLIAYCEELPEESIEIYKGQNEIIILIGPEGDFTKTELDGAEVNGFKRVNLGVNRLRTETAGLVALTKLI